MASFSKIYSVPYRFRAMKFIWKRLNSIKKIKYEFNYLRENENNKAVKLKIKSK